eukprot:g12880.t1
MEVVLGLVKVCLCGTFCLSGICKLTPKWGADVYAAMDEAFRNRFVPFWHEAFYLSALGLEVDPAVPKICLGGVEVLCAVLLLTKYKFTAAIILFGLMSLYLVTHLFLGEFSELPTPLVLCMASLGVGFV